MKISMCRYAPYQSNQMYLITYKLVAWFKYIYFVNTLTHSRLKYDMLSGKNFDMFQTDIVKTQNIFFFVKLVMIEILIIYLLSLFSVFYYHVMVFALLCILL